MLALLLRNTLTKGPKDLIIRGLGFIVVVL